jgi:DNA-binding IclR family transcriptional regulator
MKEGREGGSLPVADKSAALLALIIRDDGRTPLRELAEELRLPLSTVYRLIASFTRAGFLTSVGRGRYAAGIELLRLTGRIDRRTVLAGAARPHLRRLARELRRTTHLGILENDMVTYLLKEHGGGPKLFSRAGMQLEAYCSAIGKMLLASLSDAERDQYIAAGPFVALTRHTISDPAALRRALLAVRRADYAVDDEEVAEKLWCLAAPIRDRTGTVIAAVSVSRMIEGSGRRDQRAILAALRACVGRIEQAL